MVTLITMSGCPRREQMASVNVPPRSMAMRASSLSFIVVELLSCVRKEQKNESSGTEHWGWTMRGSWGPLVTS
jgi:hypothetical protein